MTPLAIIGEAVKALRTRLTTVEHHSKSVEEGLVDVFATYPGHITDLYAQVDDLKAENQKLHEKIEKQDTAIIEILDVVMALKPS